MQSMSIITAKVTDQKIGHMMNDGMIVNAMTVPVDPVAPKLKILMYYLKIRLKNTSESCPCASDKAQSLR